MVGEMCLLGGREEEETGRVVKGSGEGEGRRERKGLGIRHKLDDMSQ